MKANNNFLSKEMILQILQSSKTTMDEVIKDELNLLVAHKKSMVNTLLSGNKYAIRSAFHKYRQLEQNYLLMLRVHKDLFGAPRKASTRKKKKK